VVAIAVSACGDDPESIETHDTGPPVTRDARVVDARPVEAGFEDAAAADATPVDAADATAVDAGGLDASITDAGPTDAGPTDAGPTDAGPTDAGPTEAGPIHDAASAGDADPAGEDATPADSGAEVDAATQSQDATPADSGAEVDAGSTADSGTIADTGVAAPDAGGLPAAFDEHVIDDTFRHGQAIEVIDIDGDGDLDVVGNISLTDTVRLYLNNGDGTSWTTVPVAANGAIVATESAIADLDGDGDLDVATAGFFQRSSGFTSPGEVTWFEQPNSGVTQAWTEHAITGPNSWGVKVITAGDLTGDGRADLIVGRADRRDGGGAVQGNGVHLLANTGGAFSAAQAIDAALLELEVLRVHDVDGDGVLDVIAASDGSDQVAWYENLRVSGTVDATPSFTKHVIANVDEAGGIDLAQLDGDAELELFVAWADGSGGRISWYDPPADPRQPWTENTIDNGFGGNSDNRVAAGDFNFDGRMDVAVSSSSPTASARIYINDAAMGWTLREIQAGYRGSNIAAGDVDGDGATDVLGSTYNATGNQDFFHWWRPTF